MARSGTLNTPVTRPAKARIRSIFKAIRWIESAQCRLTRELGAMERSCVREAI